MTEDEFKTQVQHRIKTLRQDGLYSQDRDAFAHLAVETLLDLSANDAVDACDVGASNDKGLDAFHDDETGQITLIEARYATNGKDQDADGVLQLERAFNWLRTHKQFADGTALPAKLVEAATAVRSATAVNSGKTIALWAVSSTGWTGDAMKTAARLGRKLPENVSLRLVGAAALLSAELDRQSRLETDPINELLPIKQHFAYKPDGGPQALVAIVDGHDLAKLQGKYRYRLFQRNVRYFIGLGSGQRINRGILDTLQSAEGRSQFWYFNNGVAVVCDSVEVIEKDGSFHAQIENLQIVNGCQTTTTLGQSIDELADDVRADLLVRFIATRDESLQRKITRYTNKQNAVRDRDLMANEDIQELLQKQFNALQPPWYYERKRGGWKAEVIKSADREAYGSRVIDNERAAQAAYAFYVDPATARARKRNLFLSNREDPDGLYDAIFNDEVTPYRLLVPHELAKRIGTRRTAFTREYKATKTLIDKERPRTLSSEQRRVMSREWLKFADEFFLGAIGLYVRKRVDLMDDDILRKLSQPSTLDVVFKRAYRIALEDLGSHFRMLSSSAQSREEPFSSSNYVKLPANWTATVVRLEDGWEGREEEKDPFHGVVLLAVDTDR